MKRIGNIFPKVVEYENFLLADHNARKNKKHYKEIHDHDKNKEENLHKLQESVVTLTYKTSEYFIFKIYEPKEREIYKLPYYPDRIMHHALMNCLEPIWEKVFIYNSYACRKNKGIHAAVKDLKKVLRRDKEETKYCLKLDIRKFYPSIDHDILKSVLRIKIKDEKLLVILDEIIDSAKGVPIGNYLSQYLANLYLTYFDHWLKEKKKVKYYFRYADDMVILHSSKKFLRNLLKDIIEYLNINLKLELKRNYQIFPVDSRSIDFVGYRFYHSHTLLRKSIKKKMVRVSRKLNKTNRRREYVRRKLSSYFGWLKHCNSINFSKKYFSRLTNRYKLPMPEKFVSKKNIISNIINRKIIFVDYKRYDRYFKLYFVMNDIQSVISHSSALYVNFVKHNFSQGTKIKIKKVKNKYIIL